jgi:hypothetical protein
MYLWRLKKSATTGIDAKTDPAANAPQLVLNWLEIND